ncbi:hypothetical protein SAMN02799630_02451 [Paenibacillus sp. UNCCL117]|uniref:hypothetical protein n=1 Tax=unclassified Paenibacillus TaxID=185978 RepID=UPI00088236FC|nr:MULTISPECIES: hypothetical protein [unclassified Paenibacillus]SDC02106.1 hypothetical protein SAMN04488602_101119 [Paenibacillus sp. cl123]SFW36780.1 hypothetical protein SAMN02799630_02451 [Paenibacillus sp. UNCCL117]
MQGIPDLLKMDCRLSVSRIDNRHVQTKQAKVELTYMDGKTVRFVSQLALPVHRHIIVSFTLALPGRTVVFTGRLAGSVSANGVHRYTAIHTLDEASRKELLKLIGQRQGYKELQRDKAADCYLFFHSAPEPVSSIDRLA